MARRRTDRERELDEGIEQYGKLGEEARKRGNFTAAVQAFNKAERLKAERARLKELRLAEGEKDPVLATRRRRRLAASEGSWVAAQKYEALETDLRIKREEAELARRREELEDLTTDELIDELRGAVAEVPRDEAMQITEAVVRAALARGDLDLADLDFGPDADVEAEEE